MDIGALILELLSDIQDVSGVNDDTLLLEEGYLDSMGILYLIGELESRLNIVISLESVVEENFTTIKNISAFVAQLNEDRPEK